VGQRLGDRSRVERRRVRIDPVLPPGVELGQGLVSPGGSASSPVVEGEVPGELPEAVQRPGVEGDPGFDRCGGDAFETEGRFPVPRGESVAGLELLPGGDVFVDDPLDRRPGGPQDARIARLRTTITGNLISASFL
jgi:hypothetical protein